MHGSITWGNKGHLAACLNREMGGVFGVILIPCQGVGWGCVNE